MRRAHLIVGLSDRDGPRAAVGLHAFRAQLAVKADKAPSDPEPLDHLPSSVHAIAFRDARQVQLQRPVLAGAAPSGVQSPAPHGQEGAGRPARRGSPRLGRLRDRSPMRDRSPRPMSKAPFEARPICSPMAAPASVLSGSRPRARRCARSSASGRCPASRSTSARPPWPPARPAPAAPARSRPSACDQRRPPCSHRRPVQGVAGKLNRRLRHNFLALSGRRESGPVGERTSSSADPTPSAMLRPPQTMICAPCAISRATRLASRRIWSCT